MRAIDKLTKHWQTTITQKATLGEVVCCLRDTKETGRTSESAVFAIALKHYFSVRKSQ